MDTFSAVLLGAVQGLTEFLPVSSSGHLVLGGVLLGFEEPHFFFGILVHAATLIATVAYYRKSLLVMAEQCISALKGIASGRVSLGHALQEFPEARLTALIVVSMVPTGIIGVGFKDALQGLFAAPQLVAGMLLVTGTILLSTRFFAHTHNNHNALSFRGALLIGLVQGLAIIPGISRSGSTIACALFLGVERELAARFSFLMSLPVIFGALLLQILDGGSGAADSVISLAAGFLAAAAVGTVALAVLVPVVKRGRLYLFSWYLFPAGLIGLYAL